MGGEYINYFFKHGNQFNNLQSNSKKYLQNVNEVFRNGIQIKIPRINEKLEQSLNCSSFYKVFSGSLTTSKSTLAWRRIYSEEEPTSSRSKALRPVAPTIIRSTLCSSGISVAKRVLGLPISMTMSTYLIPDF